jgi:hypothetical protein
MITVVSGLPGQGKTLWLSRKVWDTIERNKKLYKKYGIKRYVYLNFKLKEGVMDEKNYGLVKYFSDIETLLTIEQADVFIDELSLYFDAQDWQTIPREVKFFLRQHRKKGLDIYATAQDFPTVDISFRRLTDVLYVSKKMIGTPSPRLGIKNKMKPWGFFLYRNVSPETFKAEKEEYKYMGFPSFRKYYPREFELYDTNELIDVPPAVVKVQHITKVCDHCGWSTVVHR